MKYLDNNQKGLFFGIIAGLVDVFFATYANFTLSANVAIFITCVLIGLFIATTKSNIQGTMKGLGIAFLLIMPTLAFILPQNIAIAISIGTLTLVFGAIMGRFIDLPEKITPKHTTEKKSSRTDFETTLYKKSGTTLFRKNK